MLGSIVLLFHLIFVTSGVAAISLHQWARHSPWGARYATGPPSVCVYVLLRMSWLTHLRARSVGREFESGNQLAAAGDSAPRLPRNQRAAVYPRQGSLSVCLVSSAQALQMHASNARSIQLESRKEMVLQEAWLGLAWLTSVFPGNTVLLCTPLGQGRTY